MTSSFKTRKTAVFHLVVTSPWHRQPHYTLTTDSFLELSFRQSLPYRAILPPYSSRRSTAPEQYVKTSRITSEHITLIMRFGSQKFSKHIFVRNSFFNVRTIYTCERAGLPHKTASTPILKLKRPCSNQRLWLWNTWSNDQTLQRVNWETNSKGTETLLL